MKHHVEMMNERLGQMEMARQQALNREDSSDDDSDSNGDSSSDSEGEAVGTSALNPLNTGSIEETKQPADQQ